MLMQSRDDVSRGPDIARSRRLAADLSDTMASFADEQSYQDQGRQMSSRFGREHNRQQPSVISVGRESTYATDAQLSMSRISHRVPRAGAAGRAQGNAGLAAQPGDVDAEATVQYAIQQEPAVAGAARPVGGLNPPRSRAAQSHHSTVTLAYAPGGARGPTSGQKRQPANLNNTDAQPASEEGGYNTRAKRGRVNAQ